VKIMEGVQYEQHAKSALKVDAATLTGLACVGDCANVVTWDRVCVCQVVGNMRTHTTHI
jgi:hypothetical protein